MTTPTVRGRVPNQTRHATSIQEAERKFADKLPEIADLVLQAALGVKEETCPVHSSVLVCPETNKDGEPCKNKSRGHPTNERMMVYVLNRIAGAPTIAGDRQINMGFVRDVSQHVTDVFKSVNELESPEERAINFARGIAEMWALVGSS